MPTIHLDKAYLHDATGLSDDELEHYITYLGTEVEDVTDDEVVVEVFPNRPDLLSEPGMARALQAFTGAETGVREYGVEASSYTVTVDESVSDVRPCTACAVVEDVDIDTEVVMKLQEKLHVTYGRGREKVAIGVYPLQDVSFPIRYSALDPDDIEFQPLGAESVMSAGGILDENEKGKQYGHLLDGASRYPVFIDADDTFLSMPPVINSVEAGEIGDGEGSVFVECSGHDQESLGQALNIVVTALAEMGGVVREVTVEYPDESVTTPDLTPETVPVGQEYVEELLGFDVDPQQLLARMGVGYEDGEAVVPAYRADVLHPVDVVEDVAVAYGYDRIEPDLDVAGTIGGRDELDVFEDHVREVLVSNGLLEVQNYTLSSERVQNELMDIDLDVVELLNSVSEEYDVLRAWITPCVLETLGENTHRRYPQELFEIGRIASPDDSEATGVAEAVRCAAVLCGEGVDYTDIRQLQDSLFHAFDVDARYEATSHPSFIDGRCARVYVEGEGVSYIGEVKPGVLDNFDIAMPTAAFELNLSDLYEQMSD